ncbi:hypothetical protein G6F37_006069 [Rhizopus arrhizus]|nr:hypothetical protein G6F38_004364 [Rhizopus arrhizus]KAG1158138.1 hypothetical protein G6F37_006069 [Rhizopus arrhizus]
MKISFAFAATCLLTQVVYAARKSASASFDAVAEPSASAAQINKQADDLYQKIATAQNPKYLSAHVAAVKDFVASMKATVASMKSSANSKKHQHPVSSMASFSLKATAKPKLSTSVKAFGISKGKKRAGSSMVSVVSKVSILQASAATKKNRRAMSSMASASKVSVVSKRNKRAASSRASASVKNQRKRAASSMASASVKAFALPKASASIMKRAISSMASASISAAKPSASVVKRAEQFVSGKAEAPQPSFATNQEPELDETSEEVKSDIEEQDPFWIDDEEAEVQFKGYDWSVLQ